MAVYQPLGGAFLAAITLQLDYRVPKRPRRAVVEAAYFGEAGQRRKAKVTG